MQNSINSSKIVLTGKEKAAALLMVMGQESATKLAGFLSKEEIKNLSAAAPRLKNIDFRTLCELVDDFGDAYLSNGIFSEPDDIVHLFDSLITNEDETSKSKADTPVPEQENDGNSVSPEIEVLKVFVETEPVVIGAFLLGILEDEVSAKLLSSLEPETRNGLFKAYINRKETDPAIRLKMMAGLFRLLNQKEDSKENSLRIEDAARLINFVSDEDSDALIAYIGSENPDAAEAIKKSIFKFSALVDLAKEARAIVFDNLESEDIIKSLCNAENNLKECVLEVLSQRNRRIVEAGITQGGFDEKTIEASQRKVSGLVVRLVKEGKIKIDEEQAA